MICEHRILHIKSLVCSLKHSQLIIIIDLKFSSFITTREVIYIFFCSCTYNEGSEFTLVDFDNTLNIFKEKNCCILTVNLIYNL